MSDNVIKIMCPKCMEESEYEYTNNMMFVKKDDFTTDLLNQGFTKGYNKAIDYFVDKVSESIIWDVLAEIMKRNINASEGADMIIDYLQKIAEQLKEGIKNE